MAANQFGKIKFSVQIDRKSFQTGLKQAERGIDGLVSKGQRLSSVGAQLRGLGEGVNRLGRRLAFGGALFSAPFVAATKQAGDFERKLASIKVNIGSRIRVDPKLKSRLDSVSGDAVAGVRMINKEYGNLEKTFRRLAKSFPKGPGEIAGAATQLARAGLSKSLIQGKSGTKKRPQDAGRGGILRPLVQLSVADTTGASLDEITDKTIKLLKAFDLLREGAGKSTEQVAKETTTNLATILKASTQANVSVISLAESMKFAGGILASSVKADSTGKAFREVIAVTSVLQERLGDASIAGTALRGMMLRLKSPTGEVAQRLKDAGFSIKSIRDASKDGRAGLLEMLKGIEAVKKKIGASSPEFEDFLGKIFENRQITAALSLIDETGDRLSKRVSEMKIDGDPQKFFDQFEKILNDNVAGAAGRTKSAIEDLSLAIGGALSEAAQGVLAVISDLANVISDFAENNPMVVKSIALLTAALVPLGVATAGLGAVFSTLSLPIIAAGLAMQNFTKFAAAANAPFALLKKTALGIVTPFETASKLMAGGGAGFFGASAAGGVGGAVGAGIGGGAAAASRSLPVMNGKSALSTLPIVAKGAAPSLPILGGSAALSTLPIVKRPPATQMGLFGDNGDATTFNRIASTDRSKLAPAPKKPSGQMLFPLGGSNTDPRVPKSLGFGPKLSKKSAGIIKKLEMPAKDMAKGSKKWKTLTKQLGRLGVEARKLSISELQVAVAALQTKLAASTATPKSLPKGMFPNVTPMSRRSVDPLSARQMSSFNVLDQQSERDAKRRRDVLQTRERSNILRQRSARDTSNVTARRSPAVFGDFFAGKGKPESTKKGRKRSRLSSLRLLARDRFTSTRAGQRSQLGSNRVLRNFSSPFVSSDPFGGMFGGGGQRKRRLDLKKGFGTAKIAERARNAGGAVAAAGKSVSGKALSAGAKSAKIMSAGLAGVASGFIGVVGTIVKFVAGIAIAVAKFGLLVGVMAAVVISGNTIGNAFDSITESFKTTGLAFKKSFGAISKVLESLKFDSIGKGVESAGDKINKVLTTVKAAGKAIFLSLATEIFDGIVNLGVTVFTSLIEGIKSLISGLFDFIAGSGSKDGGFDPFQRMKDAFVNARDQSLADLDAISSDADRRSNAGRKAMDDLTADFLSLDKSKSQDPEELQRKRDEIAGRFKAGEFGSGMSGIQRAAEELRSAASDINRADLLEAGRSMSEALVTATEEFREKLGLIDKMVASGQINERRAEQFRGLAATQFKDSSPLIKAAEEHKEAAKQLMEAGKSLEGRLDPRVSLQSTVEEYSKLFAAGAINLKTFREAVADAEKAESRRLDSLEEEREKEGFSQSGSGQLGGGTFFSKFNSLLGGTESESTLRKNNLKANIDFLSIAKQAFTKVKEKISNTDFGIAVKQTITDLGNAFNPVVDGLTGAADSLMRAAEKLENNGVLAPPEKYTRNGFDPAGTMNPYQRSMDEWLQGVPEPKPTKPPAMTLPESVTQPRASLLQKMIDKESKGFFSSFYMSSSTNENRTRYKGGDEPDRIQFRANGGPVSSGGSYVVGEKGPELFFPTQSGHILSNDLSSKVDGMFAGGTKGAGKAVADAVKQAEEQHRHMRYLNGLLHRAGTDSPRGQMVSEIKDNNVSTTGPAFESVMMSRRENDWTDLPWRDQLGSYSDMVLSNRNFAKGAQKMGPQRSFAWKAYTDEEGNEVKGMAYASANPIVQLEKDLGRLVVANHEMEHAFDQADASKYVEIPAVMGDLAFMAEGFKRATGEDLKNPVDVNGRMLDPRFLREMAEKHGYTQGDSSMTDLLRTPAGVAFMKQMSERGLVKKPDFSQFDKPVDPVDARMTPAGGAKLSPPSMKDFGGDLGSGLVPPRTRKAMESLAPKVTAAGNEFDATGKRLKKIGGGGKFTQSGPGNMRPSPKPVRQMGKPLPRKPETKAADPVSDSPMLKALKESLNRSPSGSASLDAGVLTLGKVIDFVSRKAEQTGQAFGIGETPIKEVGRAFTPDFLEMGHGVAESDQVHGQMSRMMEGVMQQFETVTATVKGAYKVSAKPKRKAFSPSEFDPTGELERRFEGLDYDEVRKLSDTEMQTINGVRMEGLRNNLGMDSLKELGRRDAQERSDRTQAQKLKAFDLMDYKKAQSKKFQERGGVPSRDPETGELNGGYDLSGVSDADLHAMSIGGVSGIQPNNMSVQGELTKRSRAEFHRYDDPMMQDYALDPNPPEQPGAGLQLIIPEFGAPLEAGHPRIQMDNFDTIGENTGMQSADTMGMVTTLPQPTKPDFDKMAKDRQRAHRADRKARMEEARQRKMREAGEKASNARRAGGAVGSNGNMLVSTNRMPQPAVDAGRAGAAARNNQSLDLSKVAQEATMQGMAGTLIGILRNLNTNGGMGQ